MATFDRSDAASRRRPKGAQAAWEGIGAGGYKDCEQIPHFKADVCFAVPDGNFAIQTILISRRKRIYRRQ